MMSFNKKWISLSFLLFLFTIVILIACGKEGDDYPVFDEALTLEQNVDQFIKSFVGENSPGVSILIRKDRKIILEKNFGLSDISEQQSVNSNTSFYLASVSKQFTAMSIMLLQEKGLLQFSDPIHQYVQEAPAEWSEVTIHHLLTHRSGIPDYLNDLEWYRAGITNQDVLQDLVKITDLEFEPGSKYDYSNSGYLLLSLIASRISELRYHEFMKKYVFDTLGMTKTLVFDESRPSIPDRAIGYDSEGGLRDYDLLTTGDGGMFSTVSDLDKWDQSFYDNSLISEETKRLAYTDYESDGYGYGWGIRNEDGVDHYAHGGGLAGYRTLISRIPSEGFSVIILSNGSYDWVYSLRNEIVRLYL